MISRRLPIGVATIKLPGSGAMTGCPWRTYGRLRAHADLACRCDAPSASSVMGHWSVGIIILFVWVNHFPYFNQLLPIKCLLQAWVTVTCRRGEWP